MLLRLVVLLAALSSGTAKHETLAQEGGAIITNEVVIPVASFPIVDSDGTGHRNLKGFHPQAEETHKSNQGDEENFDFFDHFDNVTKPELRSLAGEVCYITNTISGLSFDDNLIETGVTWTPADPHGAVGASRLVSVVNSMLDVRQKDGTLKFRRGLQSFFSSVAGAYDTNFFFNPKVVYDEYQGRFLVLALQRSTSPRISRIWLAVSTGEKPDTIDLWKKVSIDAIVPVGGGAFVDFPGFEVDEEAVYITNNVYRFDNGQYAGVRLWWFSKGGFYAGQPFSVITADPFSGATDVSAPATTMPAQVHGNSGVDGSVGTYLVSLHNNGEWCLRVYALYNPLGSFAASSKTICLGALTQGYDMPSAPQLGSNVKIITNNAQILDVVWRGSKLWVVFTINPTSGANQGQATAHWVRMSASGGTIVLEQHGHLGGEGIASQTFTYFPSVAVNSRGLVAYGYSASSSSQYVGSYASVGTSEQSYALKSGLAKYVRLDSNGKNRWGDYSSISVDKVDGSFWIFNQYAANLDSGGNGRWATAWSRLACSPGPTPTPPPTPPPIDCSITYKLYNSNTNVAVAVLTNGKYVASPPPCGKTSIEVVAPCLGQNDQVTIELYRGNTLYRRQTESQKPFFLFGDTSGDPKDGKITAGNYKIRVKVYGVWSSYTSFSLGGQCA